MTYSVITDVGQKRQTNQDYADTFVNQSGLRIFLLADGMGGHKAGNVASKLTVEDLGSLWQASHFDNASPSDEIATWLRQNIREENENIANLGRLDDYQGMGTTLEAVVRQNDHIISAHVGDSRTHLIHEGQLTVVTKDHSLVQELVDQGELTFEEAENHPNKNIITRSLGQSTPVEVDLKRVAISNQDYLLMSTDGLTNMVSNEDILGVLATEVSVADKAQALVDLANANGGLDNITVVLIRFGEGED